MYCGNCGKEIENGSKFCAECGAQVNAVSNTEPKINNLKNKKIMRLLMSVFIIVIVSFIGIKMFLYIRSIPSDEEIQVVANNLQNGSLIASDGKWIYYNDKGLCRMRLKDGSKQSVVSSDINAEEMFCIGNTLYYYSFPGYYKLNKTSGEDLGFSIYMDGCIQLDGKRFYTTGFSNYEDNGVYSVKVGNIKEGTKLSDIMPTRLLLNGDYLYVLSNYSAIDNLPNKNYGTWRMNKKGKEVMSLFDFCPAYLIFSGEQIFYTDKDKILCSADLDGKNETVFEDIVINGGLNASENYIFFINAETETIWRMDKDGKNLKELNNDKSRHLNIAGEWIFYENQDCDYEIYKMSFDGSYNQPIY